MDQSDQRRSHQDPVVFLAGGGEMGKRIRAFDWSKTSVGPVGGWPGSLKTALRIMLDSRYPMFVWWGPDLINFYNDAYAPILGQRHPAAFARPAAEIWSDIWDTVGPQAAAVLNEGRANWSEELLLIMERNQFSEETYFTYSYSPIPDDEGGIGGVFCACTEDTQRVLSQRRLHTLRTLAERATQAKTAEEACQVAASTLSENPYDLPFALLYLLDGDGRQAKLAGQTHVNRAIAVRPATVNLEAEVLPWPFSQVVKTGEVAEVIKPAETFGPVPGGAWPESPQRALVLPMTKPGQAQLAGFVVAGVSPRGPLDDQYRGFFDLLANQIATAVANARAYEEERKRTEALAELDRAKTAFFSNVSHQFRTPLTLMLGPVEDLLARRHTDLSPATASQLEVVNRNGLRLLGLVNTLLDFSRIEAGRVRATYQPTDLSTLTADLASVFRAAVERAGLRLEVECPKLGESVFVDRDMWEKIVLNLLSNAFKFTFEGDIAVTLRQVGNTAELRVRDTGIGIPAEEMPRIFERFHRVQNAQGRTHEGSGIGLALVQELVKLHGGSVTAESVVGQGTTFIVVVPFGSSHLPHDQIGEDRMLASTATGAAPYVEAALRWLPDEDWSKDDLSSDLPTYRETRPVPALRAEQEQDDERPRILVADDNTDMRQYLVRLLAEPYQTRAVADGEAALAAVRERPPDLILADVMMPRLDGFGLLRELRDDPATRDLPVIMLSARAGEESRVEGLQAGADDYLIKPFSARELLARVQSTLKLARVRGEAEQTSRQRSAQFRTLIDQAPLGVYLVDADFRIREINPIALSAFGDSVGDVVGRDFNEVIHILWEKEYADEIARRFRHTLETGEPYVTPERAELRLDRRTTECYEWRLDRIPLPDDRHGVVCYFRDVSAQVTARKVIEESREALRDADRRKDEFLATLAHELRNPLAPILNAVQILNLQGQLDPTSLAAREMIERQVAHMVRLIDDLLDVGRITQGKLQLRREPVELAAVVEQAVEASRPHVESLGHELTVSLPPPPIHLDADPVRLAQVFLNLLNNACKYTEPGGRIQLAARQENTDVVVTVKDTGVGISPDHLPRLFEMFSQVGSALERSQGGLGIGLALARGLVEMHGGRIEAYSDGPGYGSEFVVRLPILTEPHAPQPPQTESRENVRNATARRILVVDDNRISAQSFAMLLRLGGHEVETAYDGLQAVQKAEAYRPELILLDIGLPQMNGYDVCRAIRAQSWGQHTVMVALTGWGQEEDRRQSRAAGFDEHLVKPVDSAALQKLLAGLWTETA